MSGFPRTTLVAIAMATAFSAHAQSSSAWTELDRYTLGGAGGWDLGAIDGAERRLYVTRGEHLMVVDIDRGKVVGDIPGLHRAHGVALVPRRHRGYVSSGGDGRVVAFDLRSLKVVDDIATEGKNPDGVLYDAASDRVFVFNGQSNDATVIDPASDKVVAKIALPGKPELAASDGRGTIYVNIEDRALVARIDARKGTVETSWSLGDCEEPSGLALDAKHGRVFSVCANRKMIVSDARDGHGVATVAIGEGPDGAAFDAKTSTIFSPNSDGTLTVVHEQDADHYNVEATVSTPPRARTVTLDEKTHHAVLAFAEFGQAEENAQGGKSRPPMKPDSFGIVIVGRR